jgi:hypothetical protein
VRGPAFDYNFQGAHFAGNNIHFIGVLVAAPLDDDPV